GWVEVHRDVVRVAIQGVGCDADVDVVRERGACENDQVERGEYGRSEGEGEDQPADVFGSTDQVDGDVEDGGGLDEVGAVQPERRPVVVGDHHRDGAGDQK